MQPSLFGEPTLSLFGEPTQDPALSQWFTPPWLAQRVASWVVRGARILEPSCGGGNILKALLRTGHSPTNLTGVEVDPRWARHCVDEMPGVRIELGDFLGLKCFEPDQFDLVVGNFPFEKNAHLDFTLKALQLVPSVIAVYPVSFECSRDRDRELWATRGVVRRRARLPDRVDYGGNWTAMFDSEVLWIDRREAPRKPGERVEVIEEVWTP